MKSSRILLALSTMTLSAIVACGSTDDADPGEPSNTATPGGDEPEPKSPLGAAVDTDGGVAVGDAGEGDGGTEAGTPSVPAGSCGTASPAKGFLASVSVKVGSATRTYALTVPAGYDGTKLYPLVVGFHGDGGNGAGYRSSFPLEAQAGGNAIFAWPNGTNNNNGHSFDQAHVPPANADVSFFDALVAQVSATYCVNTSRVYVHGMSGGAYFTNQLGRWRATAIRAIAPMSGGGPFGVQNSDYDPKNGQLTVNGPVPALMIHGLSDGTVPISEGQKSLTYWRMANKSTTGQSSTSPSPCQKQNGSTKTTTFCAIPGLGHTLWSGAPAAVWGFFQGN